MSEAASRAVGLWRLKTQPRLLKKLENYTFDCGSGDSGFILRLVEESHRSVALIEAELHWINYLAANGLRVSVPVPSGNGRLVETLETEQEALHATLFKKAPGRKFGPERDWTSEFHQNLGTFLGRMHSLTKTYEPPQDLTRRPSWNEYPTFVRPDLYLPEDDVMARLEFEEVFEWAKGLSTVKEAYGLVHIDLNFSNIRLDENKQITLFDFDDCEYNWFAFDLAVPLFHSMHYAGLPESDAARHEWFYDDLLNAYLKENSLADEWLRRIPGGLRFRRIDLYMFIHRHFDVTRLAGADRVVLERLRTEMQNQKMEPLL